MKNIIRTVALGGFLVLAGYSQAQEKAPSADQLARNRADCYAKALGLSADEAQGLYKQLLRGEEEVADLRTKLAELQAEVDANMAMHDAMAEANLTKEQRVKLEAMRKEGWKPCSEACTASEAKSCAGKADAKGACCAGAGKAAAPKTTAPAPKPNATIK